MALKLQDFIDIDQFQMLQDRLNEIYSFPSAIIDNEGKVLTATAWQDICTKFHRQSKECEKECIKSDRYIVNHLHEANPAVSYQCPHGLIDNATPIIIEGVHYGNFFTGQFFLEPPDLNYFRTQAKRHGFEEEAYIEAVKKVPIWTKKQLNSYLFFIKGLIEVISAIGLKNLKEIETRKKIQESEELNAKLIATLPDIVVRMDIHGQILFVNEFGLRMSGYERADFIGRNMLSFISPEDRERAALNTTLMFERRLGPQEYRLILKDGRKIPIEANGDVLRNEDGSPFGMVQICRDITARKQAEEQTRELLLALESVPNGIIMHDADGKILYANERAYGMHGYDRDEFMTLNLHQLVVNTREKMVDVKIQEVFDRGEISFEVEHYKKNGTILPLWVNVKKATWGGKSVFLSIEIDITDRKRADENKRSLEERLRRAEKMEALGQMAGGVAHDLNNVLGILSGYSELLLLEIPEGSRSRGHVEKILQSTEKGAAIIQDLLTMARRGVLSSDAINLNSVVSDFLKTPVFEKMKDYHPRVTFRLEMDKNLLNIKGSSVHLEKTLMNVVSNAAESISGEGEVTIRTESRYLDKPVRGYDEVEEGDYAVLTVSDTGMGIPDENIAKIFEPFYTKKAMGRSGTGLGLAIVWGTVKDHNGYIDVQTKVGEGTTFTLYFPATREEMVAQEPKVPIESYRGKGESVLVVDDIAEQREIAAGLLTRLGYEVHVVSSGEEAVDYLKSNKADILVLDMIMAPGMDGLETYRRVLRIHPKQKAIIVSGFSETERVRETQKLGAGAYVKKPYLIEKIGIAIRDELDRK